MARKSTAAMVAILLMAVVVALAPPCHGKAPGRRAEIVASGKVPDCSVGDRKEGRSGAKGQSAVAFDLGKTYPIEALKEDLRILWDMLEEGHAGLDRYAPAATLKESFEAAANGLTGPLTELEFYSRLLPLVAGIKDGHTRLLLSPACAADLDARSLFFPFGLRFLKDKVYVLRNLSREARIKDGAELLAIDGLPITDIVSALLTLIPSDAGILTARLRRLESPPIFGLLLALRFDRRESRRVRFKPLEGGEPEDIMIQNVTAGDLSRLMTERYPAAVARRPLYELSFKGLAAILTVRAFGDDPDTTRPRFPEFLKEAFRSLGDKRTPGLVIDLRGAGGGLDEYAKFLFAHVMDRPFFYYWALETKKDRYDLFRFTAESAAAAEELAKPLRRNTRGWFDVLGHPNSGLQMPREPRFSGRVAILIDGASLSATGEAMTAYHYHKKALFFGEEGGAGYYGSASGFAVTAILPNTRIQVRIPLVNTAMAVDGYPKDRGLVPDVPVAPTIEDLLAGRDPVMDRALLFLEKSR